MAENITGYVTDPSENGARCAGATVTAQNASGEIIGTTTSDENGSFSLRVATTADNVSAEKNGQKMTVLLTNQNTQTAENMNQKLVLGGYDPSHF